MSNRQLHPFKIGSNGEPFLPLRSHKNLILTPLRWTDGPAMTKFMNDPKICVWLQSPPYPYLPEHAELWMNKRIPVVQKVLQELENAKDEENLNIVDDCIVSAIRQVNEDGTDVMLGDITFSRCPWMELAGPTGVNWELKDQLQKENGSRVPGDPEILWTVGYYLSSDHHGKGIISDAVDTLLHEWAIPRMGVKKMIGTAFSGNEASVRVLEKSGFKFRETIKDHVHVKGHLRSVHILDWKLGDV